MQLAEGHAAPAYDDEGLEEVVHNCCWEHDWAEDSGIAAVGFGYSAVVENYNLLASASLDIS